MPLWPFKKPRDLNQPRNLNQLIFDYAEHQRPADRRELVALLKRTELYALLGTEVPPHIPPGTRYMTGPGDSIGFMTAQVGDLICVVFFTDRSDPRLQYPYASMNGEEALRMLLKTNVEGIVIQSRTSYFGLDAKGVREALGED